MSIVDPGYLEHRQAIGRRLRRIEGQVRGLQAMIDDSRYCIDVLDQITATTRALQAVAIELVADHIEHCVAGAAGDEAALAEKVTEVTTAISRLVKS